MLRKILLGLLLLVVLAVLVLFLVGRRPSAGRIAHAVDLPAPPEAVWPWLTEPERLKQWVGWLVAVEPLSPGDANGLGARERLVMDDPNMKQQVTMEATTTEIERPRRLAVEISAPMGFDGTVTYSLVETPPGTTRLTYDRRFRYHHWLVALMEPLVTPQAKKKLVDDLERLRGLVTAETAGKRGGAAS